MKAAVNTVKRRLKVKVRRKGIVSKKKSSRNKNSKNYLKPYNSQGR